MEKMRRMERRRELLFGKPDWPLTEEEERERAQFGGSAMALVLAAMMAFMCLCEAGVVPL